LEKYVFVLAANFLSAQPSSAAAAENKVMNWSPDEKLKIILRIKLILRIVERILEISS
jgi:hypothetical protein